MRDHTKHQPTEGVVYEVLGIIKLNTKQDLMYDVLKTGNPKHCHTVTTLCGRVLTGLGHSHGESLYNLKKQIVQVRGENLILPKKNEE
jgi:hypothetical protein